MEVLKFRMPVSAQTRPGRSINAHNSVQRFIWELGIVSGERQMDYLVHRFFQSARPFAPGSSELGLARKGIKRFKLASWLEADERHRFVSVWDLRRRMDRNFVGVGRRRSAHRKSMKRR